MPKKLKNYRVRLLASCDVCVIGAKNEADAIEIAENEANHGDFDVSEMTTEELKTPEALESCRRHAECVSEPEPR